MPDSTLSPEASKRTYRQDVLAAAQTTTQHLDEVYRHDDLSRLNNFVLWQLGTLSLQAGP